MKKINISKDLLLKLYVDQDLRAYQIADELGTSRQTICNKLADYGIKRRESRYISSPKKIKLPKKILKYKVKADFQKVYRELKSINLVAEHYKVSIDTAFNWKSKHGIETIKGVSELGITKINEGKPWVDREHLSLMYDEYSIYDLAKIWNCHPTTISKWLKRHEISIKTYSEQWDRKSKYGARVLKEGGFDLQEYKSTYDECSNLSTQVILYIKNAVGCCQCCGELKILDLHHINLNPKDNRPCNHVILCPNCHAKIHRLGGTVEELCPHFISWDKLID